MERVSKKFVEAHIKKTLDNIATEMQREYDTNKSMYARGLANEGYTGGYL